MLSFFIVSIMCYHSWIESICEPVPYSQSLYAAIYLPSFVPLLFESSSHFLLSEGFVTLWSLENFRRLCILKGVFPREPKKKVKGNHHTYYHLKDIAFLQHDPLLEKFREIRAYEKKIKKAEAKKNKDLANRLLTRKPGYTLDRLIRERFVGALSFSCCVLYPSDLFRFT